MDHFFENIERKIAGILELKTRILNAMEPAVITIFSLLEKKKISSWNAKTIQKGAWVWIENNPGEPY